MSPISNDADVFDTRTGSDNADDTEPRRFAQAMRQYSLCGACAYDRKVSSEFDGLFVTPFAERDHGARSSHGEGLPNRIEGCSAGAIATSGCVRANEQNGSIGRQSLWKITQRTWSAYRMTFTFSWIAHEETGTGRGPIGPRLTSDISAFSNGSPTFRARPSRCRNGSEGLLHRCIDGRGDRFGTSQYDEENKESLSVHALLHVALE